MRQGPVTAAPLGGMPDCFGDEPFGMLECRFDVEAAGPPSTMPTSPMMAAHIQTVARQTPQLHMSWRNRHWPTPTLC